MAKSLSSKRASARVISEPGAAIKVTEITFSPGVERGLRCDEEAFRKACDAELRHHLEKQRRNGHSA